MGEPSGNNRRHRAAIQTHTLESSFEHYQNPPDYSTIVASDLNPTPNMEIANQSSQNSNNGIGPRPLFNSETYRHQLNHSRRHTTTNFPCPKSLEKIDTSSLTMPRRQATGPSSITNERFQHLTAHDVAQLLRSTQNAQQIEHDSLAPSSVDNSLFVIESNSLNNHNSDSGQEHEDFSLTRSVEELVLNEIPVGESNAAASFCDKD